MPKYSVVMTTTIDAPTRAFASSFYDALFAVAEEWEAAEETEVSIKQA